MYHFIYPTKDTYIVELNKNSEKNFGGDGNLVLKKEFDGNSLKGVSRLLLEFDVSELSQSILSGEITNPQCYLRLYEQKAVELSPAYQLKAFPLSGSWEEGSGVSEYNPNSSDGASWDSSNEEFSHTSWSLSITPVTFMDMSASFSDATDTFSSYGQLPLSDSGSRSDGGGTWYVNEDDGEPINLGGGFEASQSFSYESTDINMNITDIVNHWISGSIPNNGLIIKWEDSQEISNNYSGNINFFSSEANSIYSPKLEVRWDEHTNDYTGTFEEYQEEFGDGDGTFSYPNIPVENPIIIDGTDDNYMHMINLRKEYRETEKPRFRMIARERYEPKVVSTTKTKIINKLVPHGSGSYSIIDVETGESLIPFNEYSLLSTDEVSNYFNLKLDGFITNRLYRILLRLKLNDGRYRIFDDGFEFKVIK